MKTTTAAPVSAPLRQPIRPAIAAAAIDEKRGHNRKIWNFYCGHFSIAAPRNRRRGAAIKALLYGPYEKGLWKGIRMAVLLGCVMLKVSLLGL